MKKPINPDLIGEKDIAVIGMSGRFPMSEDLEKFWKNLRNGIECVTHFTDEDLIASRIEPSLLSDSHYIKAAPVLKDVEKFDAAFFGYSPKEAEIMDPQQRIFLELSWQALEDAGYVPSTYEGLIGVYGSIAWNTYLLSNLCSNRELFRPGSDFQVFTANDKDFMTTRVAYKLNLKGPSMIIQTACSSSLVGIHMAVLSLLNYECDMALAGGCTVKVPQNAGYYYQEGLLGSPDGHCRAFDEKAQGTIFGSGAGIVVLKRLSEAMEDGDNIYAVIKGSAINNDGSIKVSYTAPSVDGQAEVIAEAQAVAGIDPESVSYIEAHGTGTSLGDPIEVAALSKVFSESTSRKGFCSIGSVKTNIGHLDSASGVAGFIKTVLALKNREIPPSINYEKPNPKIDFENSPFFVNSSLKKWTSTDGPRRAGVSSFGVGGTNAHVILEETPEFEPAADTDREQLLVLSAKTPAALDMATARLAEYLKNNPNTNLADAAYTLKVGKTVFRHRRIVICSDLKEAFSALEAVDPAKVFTADDSLEPRQRPVIFMFTGQGSQYVNMSLQLYRQEPVFRENIDKCCSILKPYLGLDLREVIFPADINTEEMAVKLGQTSFTQPALFAVEYSMAKLLMDWGIEPKAMLGHSIGEYAAACVAGVFRLEDALMLVAKRGQLMQQLPSGSMLAVSLPVKDMEKYVGNQISLAAVNSPQLCVLSGPDEAIAGLEKELSAQGNHCTRLHTSHAFHSSMMEPILDNFRACFRGIELQAPEIPYISNLTGTWIKETEATSPDYWARHLRSAVLFSEGVKELFRQEDAIFVEVGPGQTLITLAKQHVDGDSKIAIVNTIRHPRDRRSDMSVLLGALGRLWLAGLDIDWRQIYKNEERCRVSLPAYPFERQRYWIEPGVQNYARNEKRKDVEKISNVAEWLYVPSWKSSFVTDKFTKLFEKNRTGRWLIFVDEYGIGARMTDILKANGCEVVTVTAGDEFVQTNRDTFKMNFESSEDYKTLFSTLKSREELPGEILHLWSMDESRKAGQEEYTFFEEAQSKGFYSMLYLVQALDKLDISQPVKIAAVSNSSFNIGGGSTYCPERYTLAELCKIISQEFANISCRFIDVEVMTSQPAELAKKLIGEIACVDEKREIAYCRNKRWVRDFERIRAEEIGESEPVKEKGVYIITGGTSNMGFEFLKYISKRTKGKIIILEELPFPHEREWEQWLEKHASDDAVSQRIRELQKLKHEGPDIRIVPADFTDQEKIIKLVSEVKGLGSINGVIHAAEVEENEIFSLISETDKKKCEKHFKYKAKALYLLDNALKGSNPDFAIAVSSIATIVGGLGYAAYASSNAFIDAYANKNAGDGDLHWTSINLDAWKAAGRQDLVTDFSTSLSRLAMTSEELEKVIGMVLSLSEAEQIIVSTAGLSERIEEINARSNSGDEQEKDSGLKAEKLHTRPNLQTPYAAPENDLEKTIAEVWAKAFGFDKVGVFDNFFDLGGDSLVAIHVVNQIKKLLKREIPAVSLYQTLNIRGMAQLLQQDELQSQEEAAAEFEAQKDKMNRRKQLQQRKRLSKTEKDGGDDEQFSDY